MPLEEEISSDLNLSGVWVRNRGNPYLESLKDHTNYRIPLEGGGLLDDGDLGRRPLAVEFLNDQVDAGGDHVTAVVPAIPLDVLFPARTVSAVKRSN